MPDKIIDIRSDTVTVPTSEMRKAIAEAAVGDDVFGEDPTTIELEREVAKLLGKEAALLTPSGTMANQISIACSTERGDEIIVEADSHVFQYETGAPGILSGVQMRCVPSERGAPDPDEVRKAIRGADYWLPKTSLLIVENTHNRKSGAVVPIEKIREYREIADEHNLKMHCDGARLWNAAEAAGLEPREFAEPFDSVSVCFSKGLGAPIGSCVGGDRAFITRARKFRKVLGGGMRQSGIVAAGALFALRNNNPKLADDRRNAIFFAENLADVRGISIDPDKIETNIVIFELPELCEPTDFLNKCSEKSLRMVPFGGRSIRAVFHFQVDRASTEKALEIINDVMKNY